MLPSASPEVSRETSSRPGPRRAPARRFAPLTLFASILLTAVSAHAEPQANIGLRPGVVGVGDDQWWDRTRFHLGLHGDVVYGRKRNTDFGAGPYAELLTQASSLQGGAGLTIHVPTHSYVPLLVSAGAYERWHPDAGWSPGLAAQLFVGSRSYNYHSTYVMAGGLVAQVRYGVGAVEERSIVIAAHLDGQVLSLPFLLVYEALSGRSAR